MPKAIARSKTRKAVSKRFKITGTGKVMRQHASRRHLLSSKSAKRKRHMAKSAEVDKTGYLSDQVEHAVRLSRRLVLTGVRAELNRVRGRCCRSRRLVHGSCHRPLPVGIRIRAVEIAPVLQRVARAAGKQYAASENQFHDPMQTKAHRAVNVAAKADCAGAIFREQFVSVRGYGLRTYEPRQSRNAATVV